MSLSRSSKENARHTTQQMHGSHPYGRTTISGQLQGAAWPISCSPCDACPACLRLKSRFFLYHALVVPRTKSTVFGIEIHNSCLSHGKAILWSTTMKLKEWAREQSGCYNLLQQSRRAKKSIERATMNRLVGREGEIEQSSFFIT